MATQGDGKFETYDTKGNPITLDINGPDGATIGEVKEAIRQVQAKN